MLPRSMSVFRWGHDCFRTRVMRQRSLFYMLVQKKGYNSVRIDINIGVGSTIFR